MINIKKITITRTNDFKPNEGAKYSCDIVAKYHAKEDDRFIGKVSTDDLEFNNKLLTLVADKILAEFRRLTNDK